MPYILLCTFKKREKELFEIIIIIRIILRISFVFFNDLRFYALKPNYNSEFNPFL